MTIIKEKELDQNLIIKLDTDGDCSVILNGEGIGTFNQAHDMDEIANELIEAGYDEDDADWAAGEIIEIFY